MTRAIWKGDIAFGLVSIPVSLVSVEEHNDISFHLLNAKTQSRVRYQRIDEVTGKEVPWNDIVKGYEYEKGDYILVDEKKFEKASPALFKTIDIQEFVDFHTIDTLYYEKPYYLIPEGKNKKAYVLLREALKKTKKAGVAKTILRTKEYLSIVTVHNNSLLLYLIHFSDDIHSEKDLPLPKKEDYPLSDKEMKMAIELIQDMTTEWQPEKYHNKYREALQKWLEKQIITTSRSKKGQKTPKSSAAVMDFVALLKESMKKEKRKLS